MSARPLQHDHHRARRESRGTNEPTTSDAGSANREESGVVASEDSLGRLLRRERELRAVSLEEVAQTTRIPLRTLLHLEQDEYDRLPAEVFVRGFVRSYCQCLGVDQAPFRERYLRERQGDAQESEEEQAVALNAVQQPERGRRFGVAIALVVLLILFTLALSIVLRPRHRNVPVELSSSGMRPALSVDVRNLLG